MEPFRDENELAAELRALRPTPSPAFAAALDERAAAGFPRSRAVVSPLGRLTAWLHALSPRRLALTGGAAALALVAIATVVVVSNRPAGGVSVDTSRVATTGRAGPAAPATGPSGSSAAGSSGSSAAGSSGSSAAEGKSSCCVIETEIPSITAGAAPAAGNAAHRDVERSARIVLGADPAEVGGDAAKVAETVHAYDGIVLRSSTRNGSEGAGAAFELLIPSAKLGDAMASFARIGEVRLRHEATADITAPTVGVAERLRDSRARIDSLLAQLAAAEAEGEREAVEAELAAERHHHAALRSRLTALQRRARFSRVSLRIESGKGPVASGGGWGIDDALRDAGHVLAVAAGVTIVGLAALAPLALIALLFWLGRRAWIRRGRERALA